jgi:Na+/H+ antiporter NhaD/arsenite permease-like protein
VLAVGVLALWPRSSTAAIGLLAIAGASIGLGSPVDPALRVVAPLFAFLAAALMLAASLERTGLAARSARLVVRLARGNGPAVFALTCLLSAFLTAIVSLDGAVVLMVPVVTSLCGTSRAAFAPLFLGAVTVANAASIAVPQGNPTNLVLMSRLHLSPSAFVAHMLVPGLAAAVLCAAAVAVRDRRTLAAFEPLPRPAPTPLGRRQHAAGLALAGAALAGWLAPLAGLAPWWPFAGAVAAGFALRRERPPIRLPWRLAAQVGAILVAIEPLAHRAPVEAAAGLPGLIGIALALGAVAAVANNLPASASATTILASGPAAYAASIGLAVGALATPQGSVATLIASDLAGPDSPDLPIRRLVPLAAAATLLATVVLWLTL